MDRHEHVAWCKQRALEILDSGDRQGALDSMHSDLKKHAETREHPALTLGAALMVTGNLQSAGDVRRWIEGFN